MSEPIEKLRECFNEMDLQELIDEGAFAELDRYLSELTDSPIVLMDDSIES